MSEHEMVSAPGNGQDDATASAVLANETESLEPDFDETTYLRAFPDIAEAVRRGTLESGLAHFLRDGRTEMRLERAEYRALLNSSETRTPPQLVVDTLTLSPSGAVLMTGWSDDHRDPLTEISLEIRPGVTINWKTFPRLARGDVERTLDAGYGYRHGFVTVSAPLAPVESADLVTGGSACIPTFLFSSGVSAEVWRDPAIASDAELRDLALAALQSAVGGQQDPAEIHAILDQHAGAQIAALNRHIISQSSCRRLVERFGPDRAQYRGSIITTARGGPDQIVPWLTLTGAGSGGDHEFIVVVTDADQFSPMLRAARIADATLGLPLTIVLNPGGDPAGPGEEASSDIVRSGRLIFMDGNIFPRDPNWVALHSRLLDEAPPERTLLMGALLYRPDGTLAQGGYFFERTTSLLPGSRDFPRQITTVELKVLTHPAPSAAGIGREPRAVAGVPVSFLSVDRAWFEALGGFTRQYCRASHEDIDLCLRSLRRGFPAWIHPLRMWQFERRATGRPEPSRGGAILNQWLLHGKWDAVIVPDLLGRDPVLQTTSDLKG